MVALYWFCRVSCPCTGEGHKVSIYGTGRSRLPVNPCLRIVTTKFLSRHTEIFYFSKPKPWTLLVYVVYKYFSFQPLRPYHWQGLMHHQGLGMAGAIYLRNGPFILKKKKNGWAVGNGPLRNHGKWHILQKSFPNGRCGVFLQSQYITFM